MIIRLIDIVLIILFGFIAISDIDIKAAISLPSKKTRKLIVAEKKQKIPVYIEIDQNDVFWVFKSGQKRIQKKGIFSLETFIKKLKVETIRAENKDIAVIIKPKEMSPIQSTVNVLDMCDRNKIPKNIARKSLAIF
jgi:biopolymer transport protein ExbD